MATTDRLTYCAICLSYCQAGWRLPLPIVQTAGAAPGPCPGTPPHNPNCPSHVPVPAT